MKKAIIILLIIFGGTIGVLYNDYKHITYDNGFDYSYVEMYNIGSRFTNKVEFVSGIGFLESNIKMFNDIASKFVDSSMALLESFLTVADYMVSFYNKFVDWIKAKDIKVPFIFRFPKTPILKGV